MRKIANTTELETELHQLLAYAGSRRPSRVKLARQMAALSERVWPLSSRVAEEWNTAGNWYMTDGFPGEQLYFRATGQYQKNGKAMGILVTLDLNRPRARPRAKRYSADRQWQRSFKKVPLAEVPPKVKAAAAPFEDPIPAGNAEPHSSQTNPHVFPVGAIVLVNGKDEARVTQVFPEGSSSFMHPHYVVDMIGGDRNVKVPMSAVGVEAHVSNPARWPKLR